MVAPEVVVARLTMTAPFCAAEVEMVGAAAWVCVGVELVPLAPPHPHIKAPDNTIAASTAVSICWNFRLGYPWAQVTKPKMSRPYCKEYSPCIYPELSGNAPRAWHLAPR